MKDKDEYLWNMYNEHNLQARHHEVQRTSISSTIVAVSAGILAFIANGGVQAYEWPLATFLIIIGLFGAIFSIKQYETTRFHMNLASEYRKKLEEILDPTTKNFLSNVRLEYEPKHNRKYWYLLPKARLYWFYVLLYLIIAYLGYFLLKYIKTVPSSS